MSANITRKNAPCWYEIGLNKSTGAFVLRVHKDFVKGMRAVPENLGAITAIKKEYGFSIFHGSIGFRDEYFGFDKSFLNKGIINEFFELEAELPSIIKKGNKCSNCNDGKKQSGERCLYCEGCGFIIKCDWEKSFSISASLSMFFSLVNFPEYVIDYDRNQLIAVQSMAEKTAHGGSFRMSFSAPFALWLRENKEKVCDIALGAMVKSYRKMNELGLTSVDEYHFRVSAENGKLIMNCPGDACGLQPEDFSDWSVEKMGYVSGCHNVDTPLQQFTLFSGVFALHDEARKDGV